MKFLIPATICETHLHQPKSIYKLFFLQALEDILQDFLGGGLAAHVGREELSLIQVGIDSSVDLSSGVGLTEELEHQSNGAQGSNGVSNALTLDIGGRAVARLTNGETVTHVGARDETQTADQSGSTVRQDVTIQVGGNNDIVVLGLAEELVDHGVDDLLLDVDGGELLGGKSLASGLTEQAVGLRQDVRLVGDGDHGLGVGRGTRGSGADTLAAQSDLTSNGGDAVRGALRDTLDRLGDLAVGALHGALLLHVQVLGVLTDNDQVDGLAIAATGGGLDGADIGVQVELLAESNDGGGVAGDLGGGGAGDW